MEDLWKQTEKTIGCDCDVCNGNLCCGKCGSRPIEHFPEYAYRLLVHLVDVDMSEDDFASLAEFFYEKDVWRQVGHYTICSECERLKLLLEDWLILHSRTGNRNRLEIWQIGRENGPVYFREWIRKDDEPKANDERHGQAGAT